MRLRTVVLCLACLCALVASGCSGATNGLGSEASTSAASSHPDFPSATASSTSSAPTTSSAAPTPTPSSSAVAAPTQQQRAAHLSAQTNGEAQVLVAVPGGYEAASYDQLGQIQFWRNSGSTLSWQQLGASRYPYAPSLGAPPDARATGALLQGMQHATFIVTGVFTGDSSGNAVAFTTGANGWGVIKAEPDGNIGPSGAPVGADGLGLSYGFAFAGGTLETQDCPLNQPIAACGVNPVTKYWVWTGHDFRRA